MRSVRPVAWLALVVATGVSATAPAQTDDAVTDVSLLSLVEYGYAGEDLESRSVQVYRIPVGIGLRDEVEHGWGLKLMLPVSIGGFELRAATDLGDLVERIETVTLYPGVEFQVPVGERWLVRPYVEVGVISAFGDRGSEEVYTAGTKWRVELGGRRVAWRLGGEGKFSVGTAPDGTSIDFMVLEAGPEITIPLGFELSGRAADLAAFAIYRRFSGLEIPRPDREAASLRRQVEVGLTFGTEPPHEIWGIRMPRFGVSHRFGNGVQAWRIVFGFPF